MTDLIEGLKAFLAQDAGVTALAPVPLIYDEEIDISQDVNMPTKAIVLIRGGGTSPATLQYTVPRVNVRCYGETPHLAMVVYEVVKLALKNMTPGVWHGTYIHWARMAADAIPFRDPDTQWPYNVSSWHCMMADQTVTA